MNRLFGNLKMNWLQVIVFAIIAGVYTGFIMTVPGLAGTSFQDIGIGYEWWILFAVIIVVNCEKAWDAALKCFAFFLISQPLVYLVEIVLGHIALDDAMNYYFGMWFKMTLLTLPGGFIAFFSKKQNALGAAVLGIGCTMELAMCAAYSIQMMRDMPHHLLSAVLSLVFAIMMLFGIQKEKKNRIIAIAVVIAVAALVMAYLIAADRVII